VYKVLETVMKMENGEERGRRREREGEGEGAVRLLPGPMMVDTHS
jgi:hypothetical protein